MHAAGLVANAPHLPVHLGAMGESVAAVFRAHPRLAPGDVFATNDPTAGGHLVGTPIPLDRGCLRPVTLTIPKGSVLDPGPTHAVAAGNVETSRRVVDVLLARAS